MRCFALLLIVVEVLCGALLRSRWAHGGVDYAPDSNTAFKYLVSALIGVALLFVARGARFGADGALGVGAVGLLGFSLATVLFSIMPLWLLASFVTGLYSALLVFMMVLLLLRGHDGDRPVVFSAGFFLVLYGFVSGLSTSVIPSVTMPAPLQDAKAGVRWLRAHAEDYNINPDCIIATGSSAGGYMGVMLGVLGNTAQYNDEIQFDVGDNLDQSSAVQGVLDFYGVSDLTIIGAGLSNYDVHDSESNTEALLVNGTAFGSNPGGSVFSDLDKTAIYSPFTYLDKNDAPYLLFHGTEDVVVSPVATMEIYDRCKELGIPSERYSFVGAGHGGWQMSTDRANAIIDEFMDGVVESCSAKK